jgi:hypothetical protein
MTAPCTDGSIECSLARIANTLTSNWGWVDWVVSVGLPVASIAASVFIGVASVRLARAANRVSIRTRDAEEAREAREGRERFAKAVLDWAEIRWSEDDERSDARRLAETLGASLRMKSAALVEPGFDKSAARAVVDMALRAEQVSEEMPPIEREISNATLKGIVQALAHSFIAFPDEVESNLREGEQRIGAVESAAAKGEGREQLRNHIRERFRGAGEPVPSDAELDEMLQKLDADF